MAIGIELEAYIDDPRVLSTAIVDNQEPLVELDPDACAHEAPVFVRSQVAARVHVARVGVVTFSGPG